MRRSTITLALATSLVLGACTSGEVVATAQIEVPDPESEGTRTQTLSDLEVQLIPFDRDQVFDSLEEAAATPEPAIPEDLLEAQDSIAAAQRRWQQLENRWNTLRDSLQTLTETMEGYNPGEPRYRELFREFSSLEEEYNRINRQKEQAFERFTELQNASIEQTNRIRIERENWAEEAFSEIAGVYEAKLTAAKRDMVMDTTNAQGIARFEDLKEGRYWVHARYELPFTELYWNVPVDVTGGEPVTIELDRGNAEERPKL